MSYSTDNMILPRANPYITDLQNYNYLYPFRNLLYPFIQDCAGNLNNVSLTLNVFNQLPSPFFANKDRPTGNISDLIWTFEETKNSLFNINNLSTAFCFAEQVLSVYIKPQGDIVGYINDQIVFAKPTIKIYSVEGNNYTKTLLYTYTDLKLAADDPDRFFTIQIPQVDLDYYAAYNKSGLYTLIVRVEYDFYKDAQYLTPLTEDWPNVYENYLQISIYSAPKEIIYVYPDGYDIFNPIDIVIDTVLETDHLYQIFSKTLYPALEAYNDNHLTIAQRRAVMADQIAFLFTGQHPVITADYVPSKIVGYGGELSTTMDKSAANVPLFGNKFNPVPFSKDRFYGMRANARVFNYAMDLESTFSNLSQSQQNLTEPLRCILTNTNGVVIDNYGVGIAGVQFYPYSENLINAEITASNTLDIELDLPLTTNTVNINNIQITNNTNSELIDGDVLVKIAFDVLSGASNIASVTYSAWINSGKGSLTTFDPDPSSRSTILDFTGLGYISFDSTLADIVKVKIQIEDINGFVNEFFAEKVLTVGDKPVITDFYAIQREDGSGAVELHYTYWGYHSVDLANVSFYYSYDNIFYIPMTYMKGASGDGIPTGKNIAVWYPKEELAPTEPKTVYIKLDLKDMYNNSTIAPFTNSTSIVTLIDAIPPKAYV